MPFIHVRTATLPTVQQTARITQSITRLMAGTLRKKVELTAVLVEPAASGSTLQSGLLSGGMTRDRIAALPDDDWRKTRSLDFQEPRLSRNLALVDCFRRIGQGHGVSAAVVAIAWTLRQPAVTGAIVGARRPSQVDGLMGAATFRLSAAELAEITRLLPEGTGANVPAPS